MNPKISVIILNWNRWENTICCLSTLLQSTYDNFNVTLIDNGSEVVSLRKIHEWIEGRISAETRVLPDDPRAKPVKVYESKRSDLFSNQNIKEREAHSLLIIRSEENLGFSGGCNLGVTHAFEDKSVKYIVLLNNDMEISKDCLSKLLKETEADELVGACQPKVFLSRETKLIDSAGITRMWYGRAKQIGHKQVDRGQYDKTTQVFGACAGAVLYRRKMLEEIGLFDEDFFAYYEDVDLCLRARAFGWKTLCVSSAATYHLYSASLGEGSPRKWYFLLRNSIFYVIKNFSFFSMICFFLFWYPLLVAGSLYRTRGKPEALRFILSGIRDGFLSIPHFWKKRCHLIKSVHKIY